jgi:outer membrane protein TolC
MSTLLKVRRLFIVGMAVSFTVAQNAAAQTGGASAQETVLDAYIHEAFASNQGLRQQNFQLEKSLYALDEARSLFLPNVSLQGSYTKAAGGRTIDVPVGDLLNGVYATLNQLTGAHNFPHLENQSFLLNPDNFYDVHLHTTLPLVDVELYYNRRIKQQLITTQQAAVNVYKRQLVKDIKTAYFQYFQAIQAEKIYDAALDLVSENIRVNQSLLANGVRNSTALTRSMSEQKHTQALRIQAETDAKNAQAYFNFLLNRPSTTDVTLDSAAFAQPAPFDTTGTGIGNREELQQWRSLNEANTLDLQLEKSYLIPQVSTFLDLGSQGTGTIDDKSRYYFWGVSLQWNLFAGGQHTARSRQAAAEEKTTQAGYEETERALQLQLDQSFNNYHSAVEMFRSAQSQLSFAQKYYNDQARAYREGQLLFVELLDAQNQLTQARLEMAQAGAGVQISLAGLERDQATYPLNHKS